MSKHKKGEIICGVLGLGYIIGGGPIVTHRWARSYYHWLGADWHMGADMAAFLLAYVLFVLAAIAIALAAKELLRRSDV